MLQIRGRLLLFWVALPFEGLGLSLLCILVGVLCELCGKKDFDREETQRNRKVRKAQPADANCTTKFGSTDENGREYGLAMP
jgi:hypothetical protein